MNVARHMVSGVDVWLNTPRRPYEASGTSGQKAAINGAPSFSILDGWWREGYDPLNGWAIGEEREYKDADTQDGADAHSLYSILEDQIVPQYYDVVVPSGPRSAFQRSAWLKRMRRAIATCGPQFSMRRMLADYTSCYYVPAMNSNRAYRRDGDQLAYQISQWKRAVREAWPSIGLTLEGAPPAQAEIGDQIEFSAQVRPGRLSVDDLAIEIVVGKGGEGRSPAGVANDFDGGVRRGLLRVSWRTHFCRSGYLCARGHGQIQFWRTRAAPARGAYPSVGNGTERVGLAHHCIFRNLAGPR